MDKKETILKIINRLEGLYPAAKCSLRYDGEPWKLLIMGRLSAQCTDIRVNIVCEDLFRCYPTLESIVNANLEDLEKIVKPCGLYRVKAKNIKDSCYIVLNNYNGILPDTMEELLTLPGVGRKIANLLLGDIYNKPSIVVDTHCIRLTGRFGICEENEKNPVKIEKILTGLVPEEKQSDFCHRLVMFGREWCSARLPKCADCILNDICLSFINRHQ